MDTGSTNSPMAILRARSSFELPDGAETLADLVALLADASSIGPGGGGGGGGGIPTKSLIWPRREDKSLEANCGGYSFSLFSGMVGCVCRSFSEFGAIRRSGPKKLVIDFKVGDFF